MRTPGKFLLVEPIKQHYVTGYTHTFAMPIGFSKEICKLSKLKSNRTSSQGYIRYALPFALPINLTPYNWSAGISNRATGRGYVCSSCCYVYWL
jgi:hypothetical protein